MNLQNPEISVSPQKNLYSLHKSDIRHIREVIDRTGWSRFEAFERLRAYHRKYNLRYAQLIKNRFWKDYNSEMGDCIRQHLDGVQPMEMPVCHIKKKAFDLSYYSEAQQKAIRMLKNGKLTYQALADFFEISLPEELLCQEDNILKRIVYRPKPLNKKNIFICIDPKYVQPDKIKRAQPVCVIGYPKYEKDFAETGVPFIPCEFLSSYVQEMCQIWRNRYSAKSVAITGSVGKTSTTEMIGLVCGAGTEMHKITGNQNTTWQIAKIVTNLTRQHTCYVQECSGSFPSQATKSSSIVRPDIFVITNVGNGHIARYEGRQELLLLEKTSLDRTASPNAVGIVNWDDPLLKKFPFIHPVKGYAIKDPSADYYADNIVEKDGQILFDVVEKSGVRTPAVINAVGLHNVLNALAGFAVGVELNIDRNIIVNALLKFKTEGIRQNLTWIGGRHLYLDCYSATEASMRTCVETMRTISVPEGGKKIALLGDVLMLGDLEEEIHRRIGMMVAEVNTADEVFFWGHGMGYAYEEAKARGIKCRHTEDRKEMESWLINDTTEKDLISIKSAHKVFMELSLDNVFGTNMFFEDDMISMPKPVKKNGLTYNCVENYGCGLLTVDPKSTQVKIPSVVGDYIVRNICRNTFKNSAIREVTIPENVQTLGADSFADCKHLTKVSLPDSLRHLCSGAFRNCTALSEIKIPGNVLTISDEAFSGCTNLKTIQIPPSVLTFGDDILGDNKDVTILCEYNSKADLWAREHHFRISNL